MYPSILQYTIRYHLFIFTFCHWTVCVKFLMVNLRLLMLQDRLFCGQMSAIYLFSESLSPHQVTLLLRHPCRTFLYCILLFPLIFHFLISKFTRFFFGTWFQNPKTLKLIIFCYDSFEGEGG
jgi:hypothetical protein